MRIVSERPDKRLYVVNLLLRSTRIGIVSMTSLTLDYATWSQPIGRDNRVVASVGEILGNILYQA